MQVHSNAATNLKQRQSIRDSLLPCRALAAQYEVSVATVHHWKHQADAHDRSCRPLHIHYALQDQEAEMVLHLRQTGRLPLDDLLESVEPLLPHVRRASLHRLLVRHGCSRLPRISQQPSGQTGTFKEYGPGFVHIDCFYLPRLGGHKRYCFVAIDRATRLVFLHVYERKNKEAATDFLARCLEFLPFRVEKILTDNGKEFTLAGYRNRWGGKAKKPHPFTHLCHQHGIQHRRTKPYTPRTNGMVERTNGLIKEGTTKHDTYETWAQLQEGLRRWFVHYNYHRQHRRLGRITPYQAACRWHEKQPELFIKEPAHLLRYCSQPDGT